MPRSTSTIAPVVILMGVSGCGKSTFGRFLQKEQGYVFTDGDDLHPKANIEKMSQGIPLDDEDRWPWLEAICEHVSRLEKADTPLVVACSALKRSYRKRLRSASDQMLFIHLMADRDEISRRLSQRPNHFMPPDLLASQFEALEPTNVESDVVEVDVTQHMLNVERAILNAVQDRY
jgi:carbohydrate kinase (thermoresistant glucokinase family)